MLLIRKAIRAVWVFLLIIAYCAIISLERIFIALRLMKNDDPKFVEWVGDYIERDRKNKFKRLYRRMRYGSSEPWRNNHA